MTEQEWIEQRTKLVDTKPQPIESSANTEDDKA
jgi:hypothetical protein